MCRRRWPERPDASSGPCPSRYTWPGRVCRGVGSCLRGPSEPAVSARAASSARLRRRRRRFPGPHAHQNDALQSQLPVLDSRRHRRVQPTSARPMRRSAARSSRATRRCWPGVWRASVRVGHSGTSMVSRRYSIAHLEIVLAVVMGVRPSRPTTVRTTHRWPPGLTVRAGNWWIR